MKEKLTIVASVLERNKTDKSFKNRKNYRRTDSNREICNVT